MTRNDVSQVKVSWRQMPPMPVPAAAGHAGFLGDQLIYAGGTTWVNGIKRWLANGYAFSAGSNQWQEGFALPVALAYGACVRWKDALEVYGGTDATEVHREHWRIEPSTHRWICIGEIPPGLLLARAEPVDRRVFVFGGAFDAALTAFSDVVWIRDADKWQRAATLPQGQVALSASAVIGRHIYLFGGCSAHPNGPVNRLEAFRFDTKSALWEPVRPLPRATRALSGVALEERYILLAGGYWATADQARDKPPDYGFSSTAWVYDTQADEYAPTESLPYALAGMEMVRHNGSVFVSGGENRMRGRSACLLAGSIQAAITR